MSNSVESVLHLRLRNFRCHREYEVTITPNKIYLLTGDSGNGKTTIFEAIYWCLYGKGTKFLPFKASPKTVTHVTLNIVTAHLNVTVDRYTNAHRLKVCNNITNVNLEDVTAQEYINEVFGTNNFWLSTSYLKQKGFNSLIKGTPGDKRKILNRISFKKDAPDAIDEILDKVDVMINEAGIKRNLIHTQFNDGLETYKRAITESNVNITDIEAGIPNDMDIYPTTINALVDDIKALRSVIEESATLVSQYRHLYDVVEGVDTATLDLEAAELHNLLSKLDLMETRHTLMNELDKHQSKLKVLNDDMAKLQIPSVSDGMVETNYSDQEIYTAQSNEFQYQQMKTISDQLNITYSIDAMRSEYNKRCGNATAIKDYINCVNTNTQRSKLIHDIQSRIDTLTQKIVSLDDTVVNVETLMAEISTLTIDRDNARVLDKERYDHLERTLQTSVITCPHCSGCMRIVGNAAIPVESFDHSAYVSEYNAIRQKRDIAIQDITRRLSNATRLYNEALSRANEIKRTQDQITTLTSQLNTITLSPVPGLPDGVHKDMLPQLEHEIYTIASWKYISPPTLSSQDMITCRNMFRRREIMRHVSDVTTDIETIQLKIDTLTAQIDNITFTYIDTTKYSNTTSIWKRLYDIDAIRKHVSDFNNIKTSPLVLNYNDTLSMYTSKSQQYTDITGRYTYLVKIKGLIDQRDALAKLRDALDVYQHREARAVQLKEAMITIQHARYAMSTARVNMELSDIIKGLYTKPLSVQLRMFKIVKKGNRIKPTVNLYVMMDNEEIDPSVISGGESDRLSIALTLALSKVRCSPILLLDECFTSLPANDRDRTIDIIVKHGKAQDRFFLCIAPNSSSDWFEKEIEVSH